MVPFRLDQTVFNDQAIPARTMADPFLGQALANSAAPTLGAAYTKASMGSDQHWNFGVQQQLTASTALEVDYVGNKGTHLAGTTAINNPPAGAGAIQNRRPYPRYGGISYFSQDVTSNYHALQAKLEKRLSAGAWYVVSYTFSKSIQRAGSPAVGGNATWERSL